MNDVPEQLRPEQRLTVTAPQGRNLSSEVYDRAGTYGSQGPGIGTDWAATLLEYWRMAYKRRWIMGSILLAFVVFGIVRTLMTVPLYTSTVRLQIDRNVTKVVEGGNVTPTEGADAEFFRTQYELLQSRAMSERVVSARKLGNDPSFFKPRLFSIFGAVANFVSAGGQAEGTNGTLAGHEAAAIGVVLANRAVRPVPGSRLVDITYSDPQPARAQSIAMAFAEAFIASNLDKRFEANSYAKTFLEDQIKQLKIKLEESDKKLTDFAEKEQIVTLSEKSSIAENNFSAANATLGALASERIKNEQLWRQVENVSGMDLPQFLMNTVIAELRARRNLLATDYQEKLQTFKPAYPAMVEISKKIAEIDRQLASEIKTIKASLKGAYENSVNQESEMQRRVAALKNEVLELQKGMLQYTFLKRDVDTNRALYDGLLQRFKEIDIASGVGANNVFIVDRAQIAATPSSPHMTSAVLMSFALGLGAAFAAAFVIEKLDDRINSQEELEHVTGLPTVGLIPLVRDAKEIDEELGDPRSALSEAYRSLGTSLQFATAGGLPKSLLITSSSPSEGKSITVVAMASYFAAMGLKVLVVDADMRKPSLHTKLGLDNSIGLSNYLTGGCTPPEALQKTHVPNMTFMSSGPVPPNAADLLGSPLLLSLVSVGLQVFDLVIFDGPPVMGLADALLLSNAAAATVFVAAAGRARKGLIGGSLRRLHHARTPLIGTVLTKFDHRRVGYGYGYGYGYGGYGGYGYGGYAYSYGRKEGAGQVASASRTEPEKLLNHRDGG